MLVGAKAGSWQGCLTLSANEAESVTVTRSPPAVAVTVMVCDLEVAPDKS